MYIIPTPVDSQMTKETLWMALNKSREEGTGISLKEIGDIMKKTFSEEELLALVDYITPETLETD